MPKFTDLWPNESTDPRITVAILMIEKDDAQEAVTPNCYINYCVGPNYILDLILSTALSVFSLVPKAVNLKYPSPLAPKPTPGVPTTLASFMSL
jgi:hypothetical protein